MKSKASQITDICLCFCPLPDLYSDEGAVEMVPVPTNKRNLCFLYCPDSKNPARGAETPARGVNGEHQYR